jgi:hypothetical protein
MSDKTPFTDNVFPIALGGAPRMIRRAFSRRQMRLNARYNGPEPRYERSAAYRPECETHHRIQPCSRCTVPETKD